MNKNRKVLLLNRGETLVDVIDWQDAINLLVKGNARSPYGYNNYYKIPIALNSAQRIKEAVLYTRNRCGDPEYSASYFCLKCAWFGNFTTFLDTPPGMAELWFKIAQARKSE